MLHLRLVVPTELTRDVLDLFEGDAAVTNVVLLRGAARTPVVGDVVLADVAREGANMVIDCLRGLGVDRAGSIAVETIDIDISQAARTAQRAAPGEGSDAVIWEEVATRTHDDATLSVTYLLFLTIATMIAAVGVLLDNPILIVGSMVVGPEFGRLRACVSASSSAAPGLRGGPCWASSSAFRSPFSRRWCSPGCSTSGAWSTRGCSTPNGR